MKMVTVKGDAITYALQHSGVFLHVCNAQGVMGSGIAKQVKERVSEAYDIYIKSYKLGGLTLGSYTVVDVFTERGKAPAYFFNIVAQDEYGRHKRQLNYGALADCLTRVQSRCLFVPEKQPIVVPYLIGCDRAGGDWTIVTEMLEYFFKDREIIACKL